LPGFVHYNHYDPTGPAPNLVLIVGVILAAASLPAIIGGVVGGRISKEGGDRQQLILAAIFGIILAVPVGCFGLWLFSGA
jgi:cation transporter-like permease